MPRSTSCQSKDATLICKSIKIFPGGRLNFRTGREKYSVFLVEGDYDSSESTHWAFCQKAIADSGRGSSGKQET